MANEGRRHHFLVVPYGLQSHVNPARTLARRLARLGGAGGSILATLSVPVASHKRMFPSLGSHGEEATDGVISYLPYSDGFDDGSMPRDAEGRERRRRAGSESLSAVVARLAGRGQPVTCVVCTMVLLPALDVAREHGIPLAAYWIQPATTLAANYHYAHGGYGELIAAHAADREYAVSLPGLSCPLRIKDFPSDLVDTTGSDLAKGIKKLYREFFGCMDQVRPKFLVNTFDELEAAVLAEMGKSLELFTVGPMVGPPTESQIHMFKHDDADKSRYMGWLGAQRDKSVVYASFGSVSKHTKQQTEEIVEGLRQSERPFLLVMRKDGLQEDAGQSLEGVQDQGVVVEWCDQLEVLAHPAVGCFLTHCGWNSTVEAIASGVPMVGVPSMFDQPTNAYLVEQEWMIGVKGERSSEGVLTATELARCIESVMGEGAKAKAIRERAMALKQRAQDAADAGGSADRNLLEFVRTIQAHNTF